MARISIEIPDELKAEIDAAADAEQLTYTRYHTRALMNALAGATEAVEAPPPSPGMVEDGVADHLLAQLEPLHATLVVNIAKEKRVRPYHLFLSYVQTALARGEASEITLEATRRAQFSASGLPAGGPTSQACAYCGKAFTLQRQGQIYCPDPEDGPGCGRLALLEELRSRRQGAEARQNQPAPPSVNPVATMQLIQRQRDALIRMTAPPQQDRPLTGPTNG